MNHFEAIDAGSAAGHGHGRIARKIFLTYPMAAFAGREEKQFEIFDEISSYFSVPITCIRAAGSAQTGKSIHKKTDFTVGKSDLDAAIIDSRLYQWYVEEVFEETKGYSRRESFPLEKGSSVADTYLAYLQKGIFRADLMPFGSLRADWVKFFNRLSNKHDDLFREISGCIYQSEIFFEAKQRSYIRNYLSGVI